MKYVCLGYMNESLWTTFPESEQNKYVDECFRYDDELRKNGHFAGGEGLQEVQNTTTLRWRGGKVSVTDGPFAETKEHIGGILVLEATDLNHAIRLLSNHPSLELGRGATTWEIRPAVDMTGLMEQSRLRRES